MSESQRPTKAAIQFQLQGCWHNFKFSSLYPSHSSLTYAVYVNSCRLQGVAEYECMAQAGSLPDIAEQTVWLSEMELRNKFPNTKLANSRCIHLTEGHIYFLFSIAPLSLIRQSGGDFDWRHLQFTLENFWRIHNLRQNDTNGRLSVGNNICISSGAADSLCWLGLNAFVTFCYRGVAKQTARISGQAKGLLTS